MARQRHPVGRGEDLRPPRIDPAGQHVHRRRTDEARDEEIRRPVVEIERRADLLDAAVVHDDDLVGHRHRLDLVVGHVIGSSLLNTTVVIGLLAMSSGGLMIPRGFLTFELPMAAIGACLMFPMLRGDMRITRAEGTILVITFIVWLAIELLMVTQ